MSEHRTEKLQQVIKAIREHGKEHGPVPAMELCLSRAIDELEPASAESAALAYPLSMREPEVRQALATQAMRKHQQSLPLPLPHRENDHIHGLDGDRLIVGAEARLYRRNGKPMTAMQNGHVTIEGLTRTEKWPLGMVRYRVLGTMLEGAVSAHQVKLVAKTDATRRDLAEVHGVAPSKRRTRL